MADISKLVVSLEAESSKLRKELERTNKKLKKWERKASRTMDTFKKNFKRAFILGGVAVGAGSVTDIMRKVVMEAADTNSAMKKLEAQMRATGNAAGFTAKQIDDFARDLARSTLASTKAVREAAGVLLSFKSIGGDAFKETLTVAQDMAETFGIDLKQATLQLGKALEDPITGLTALRRSGVSFTDSQKDMIKGMVKSGQLMKAQGVILDALRGQIGGTGKAAAKDTLIGAMDSLGQAWDELFEKIGQSGPAKAAAKFIGVLTAQIEKLQGILFKDDQKQLADLNKESRDIQAKISRQDTGGALGRFRVSGLEEDLDEVKTKIFDLQDKIEARLKDEAAAEKGLIEARKDGLQGTIELQDKILEKLNKQKKSFTDLVKETRDQINVKPTNPLIKGTILEATRALSEAKTLQSGDDQKGALAKAQKAVEVINSLSEAQKISKQFANSLLGQAEELGVSASDKLIDLKLDDEQIKAQAERARMLIQSNFSAQPFTAEIQWSDPTKRGLDPLQPGASANGSPLVLDLGNKKLETSIPAADADKMRTELAREDMKRGSRC